MAFDAPAEAAPTAVASPAEEPSASTAPDKVLASLPADEQHEHYRDLDEVNMLDDLIVDESQDFVLGEDDVPPPDDSEMGSEMGSEFGDDASEMGDAEMGGADAKPAFEPPAEDHSLHQLKAHTEPVFAVAINGAHPEQVCTGGGDDVAYLWRLTEPNAPAFKLEGHTDTISCVQFNGDGTLLATGGLEGTVRVWRAETGELVAALEGPSQGVNWLAWHARGSVLLAGSEDSTAWMWKLPEGSVMQIFSAHSASVSYGTFANNGRCVVTASEDGSVRVWNPRAGTVDHTLHAGTALAGTSGMHEQIMITCLAAHPSHPVIMFGMDDGKLKLAQVETGKVLANLAAHENSIESTGFCACLQLAASGGMDGKLCIWDLNTFALRHVCPHGAGVVELRWLKDSPLLATCTVSRELRVYDARDGACLNRMIGHHDTVLCFDLGYTPQGNFILSGSDDCTARVWALKEEASGGARGAIVAA